MKGFLSHYTPSLMNPEDLDAIFVQRQPLLTDLLENIERSVLTEAKHHALLIGPRGIGKTHLISMIYHRVSANKVFKDKLKIAWLREEEWGVATFLDLLVRILNALIEEYKDPNLEEQVKGLYSVSTEQAEQLAGHILKQYCQDKTLLLLMENLDEIFKGLDKLGQQAFRAYLQNYGFITIVATSQSLFSGVKSRNLPFYGFFSLTHLKPLVLEEAIELLANIAKWRGDQDLADLLITPLGKSRIRAIHHLAGGNHRIYIIFSQFLTNDSLDTLVKPFMQTLDDLTPFYQSRMQFISPQQRKIIEYLCDQRGKIAVKQIAQHCFISQQTASSQLKQLREMGYVYSESEGRESFYELQEPLMRICLEAKKRRGTPNQLFISFLRVRFSRKELENRLEILPLEAIFDRECTLQALAEMEVSDDPKIVALLRDWNDAWKNSKYEKMLEISEELILIRGSGLDWIKKAQAHYFIGEFNKAIQYLNQAIKIEPDNPDVWSLRGNELYDMRLFSEASISYGKSIQLDAQNAHTWSKKALAESISNQKEKSLFSIKKALEIDSDNIYVLGNASLVYERLEDIKKAILYINKVIEINPDEDRAWREKAGILTKIDIEESLRCAEISVQLNPNSSENFKRLAMIQYLKGDYQLVINSINYSIKLYQYDDFSWMLKAISLINIGLIIEGIECLDKSVDLYSSNSVIQRKVSAKDGIKSLAQNIIIYILKKGTIKNWIKDGQFVLEIYNKHNLLDDLSSGLVESIKDINELNTSNSTAQAWLEMWQNLAGNYDEFKVALNLLKVAVEYKVNRDRRVLLQLPQEERQILEELLNPESP
ncbi:MAG: tetratricopeptide repeat protein [Woronichinia naegeliana WA131]|uniref:Tetratricopeptide repeat protein n=1 Tax=Woronichinia naegeliana WA131 TaxID=2824559 RepID=A0A977KVR2_9CYAN|nr:MAG: tetratricopeptide repeat protein [Woronichinia naegeliana WA131]